MTISMRFFLDTIPEMRSRALSLMESSMSSRHAMIMSLGGRRERGEGEREGERGGERGREGE